MWRKSFSADCELILLKFNQTLILHFIQFHRHGASVNRQIVCELLPVKGNGKSSGALKPCLLLKVFHQFGTDGVRCQAVYFSGKMEVLFCQYTE